MQSDKLDDQFIPRPFLKWAGGKTQLLDVINSHLPNEIKESGVIDKYFEPFIGGGAVFFNLYSSYNIKEAYISDINKELILTYRVVKKDPRKLINKLKYYSEYYKPKSEEDRRKYYVKIRGDFNKAGHDFDYEKYSYEHIKRASQMIFLNKTCFNGLFRVNSNNEFNVPPGRSKNPLICDKSNILNVSKALKNVEIVNADYSACEKLIDDKSLVYLDPPYRPLTNATSFEGYSKSDFNDDSQKKLGEFYKRISDKGAKVLLSNSDPKNSDPNDDFFDVIYADFNIYRVPAKRYINSVGHKRGDINEILVTNFKN